MLSKFMPVRALKDVKLADVGYHNRQSQLEGMLIHSVYDSVKIILLISIVNAEIFVGV